MPAHEEQVRWFLNRARYSPEAEADRLGMSNNSPGGHPNFDVAEDVDGANDFGTTAAEWQVWKNAKPPVAPHRLLTQAATNHSHDMANTRLVQHPSPSATFYPLNSNPKNRHAQDGYSNQVFGYYENIAIGRLIDILRSLGLSGGLLDALSSLLNALANPRGRGIPQGCSRPGSRGR